MKLHADLKPCVKFKVEIVLPIQGIEIQIKISTNNQSEVNQLKTASRNSSQWSTKIHKTAIQNLSYSRAHFVFNESILWGQVSSGFLTKQIFTKIGTSR